MQIYLQFSVRIFDEVKDTTFFRESFFFTRIATNYPLIIHKLLYEKLYGSLYGHYMFSFLTRIAMRFVEDPRELAVITH